MQIVPFRAEHIAEIEWQAAQAYGQRFYCEEWSEDIAAGSSAWTALGEDGAIVACAGVFPTRILRDHDGAETPQQSLAWAVFSPALPRYAKSVYAAISRFLALRPEARIEAYVYPEHSKAACFLERLGFHFESAQAEDHPEGLDVLLYARVRH